MKDEKHEKGWKAFQRDLAWAMHQQILALRTGQEEILTEREILAKLKEIHEGKIALPDIITRCQASVTPLLQQKSPTSML